MSTQTIINSILSEPDLDTRALFEAVRTRDRIEKTKTEARNLTLGMGAKVRLQGLSPRYLNGMEGEIVPDPLERYRRRRTSKSVVSVKVRESDALTLKINGRFGDTGIVTVPLSCVTPL